MEREFAIRNKNFPELRALFETYYDVQKLRIATSNRLLAYFRNGYLTKEQYEAYVTILAQLEKIEERIAEEIDEKVKEYRIGLRLLKLKGLGAVMVAGILIYIDDISKFPTPSKLRQYLGWGDPKTTVRRKGQKCNYNTKAKVHFYKIGMQFLKAKNPIYEPIYREWKKIYENREDIKKMHKDKGGFRAHVHLMAMRKMIQRFITDLWIVWRKEEGLPTVLPYPFDKQRHDISHYEEPEW